MIAKHVPMTSAKKSNFVGLVKYLMDVQGKRERVGTIRVTNCHSEQAKTAMLEVLNIQVQNTRATGDKTYHLVISFRAGEEPEEATLRSIEERICEGLGFGEHQRVSVVHHDTDNLHMHLAINKIHPTHYTLHDPFNAYHTLGQLCDALENDHGLEKDNHKASKGRSENRASDMEHHAAIESLLGWIQRECKDKIEGAVSWDVMHRVMREHGLRIHERGNGLVITSENGVSVKASSVDRQFSKPKLEARLGTFTASPDDVLCTKAHKKYDKRPMHSRVNTGELYARYKAAQQHATSAKAAEWSKAMARKNRLTEDAKRNGRLKRTAIKLVRASSLGKKLMHAATSKTVREDIATINRNYLKERKVICEKYQRHAWADWLLSEATAGDQQALAALRARDGATGLKGDTLGRESQVKGAVPKAKQDSITKTGTIIYRVGACALRDDGDRLAVSRSIDETGLKTALRMAVGRYGNCINVNGSAAFKEKIAQVAVMFNLPVNFEEDTLEHRRQQLAIAARQESRARENYSTIDGGHRKERPERSRSAGVANFAENERGQRASRITKSAPQGVGQAPKPPARDGRSALWAQAASTVAAPGDVRRIGGLSNESFAQAAADKYIAEREQKRIRGISIQKHGRYICSNEREAEYAGTREIDGQALALLKLGDEIKVLPVDRATAKRLRRLAPGQQVDLTTKGLIKTNGWSR